jgi:uncharacterized membrane protein
MLKDFLVKILKLENLLSNLTGYLETRIELLKIEIREDVARALAKVSILVMLMFVVFLFVLFTSMAIAYQIGISLGMVAGFGIVAGFYLLMVLILYIFREGISKRIEKQVKENVRLKKK